MSPIEQLRSYLARTGHTGTSITEDAGLQIGDFHFYTADGMRVAAGPGGVVSGTRAASDAWWDLLHVGPAEVIAERVVWLESSAVTDPMQVQTPTVIVRGGDPPTMVNADPFLWRAAQPPHLDELPGGERRLTMWFSMGGEPIRLTITAVRSGPAGFEVRAAHEVVEPGDSVARAIAALRSNDAAAVRWALIELPQRNAVGAALAVAEVLTRTDASMRAAAASALAALRAPTTVAPLAQAARSERDLIALRMMLSALGAIGTADAVGALADLQPRIADVATRAQLVHALARAAEASPGPARKAMAAIAKSDPDAGIRDLAGQYTARLTP